ncbi:hypothetical protein A3F65_03080 [Candidatus Saccharibacteria bacterium RIFCSPHIGHO2_12_FULL_47_16b]|nr:MAG: hypothetical protein A3F65_03080 [Candidatus Saccharibacteria bacterium RIFCSPHIGHO2_12_FULL_47_16b]
MSSQAGFETASARLIAAIPAENESLCPGCNLDFFVARSKRTSLGKKVATHPIVGEVLKDSRMGLPLDGKGPVNSAFPVMSEGRSMADCLLTRALGACLGFTPEAQK